jgi:hypothetical protein
VEDFQDLLKEHRPQPAAETFHHFRHNRVRRFKVGKFNFIDHLCKVADRDLPGFIRAYKGLARIDQAAITHVKQLVNEQPMGAFMQGVIRGAASTDQIPDPTKQSPAKEGDTPGTKTSLSNFAQLGLRPQG